jgi:hypothetical protein
MYNPLPIYIRPPLYKPIKNHLQKNVSPRLIIGGLRYDNNMLKALATGQLHDFIFRLAQAMDYQGIAKVFSGFNEIKCHLCRVKHCFYLPHLCDCVT